MNVLLGRDTDRALLEGVVESARSGHPSAIVLAGEPGMGRSALLDAVVAAAADDDAIVLRADGVPAEWAVGYGGLRDLLRPLRRWCADGDADPGAVAVTAVEALAEAAERSLVVVAVDDVQWLDDGSRRALAFAARRLVADRVAFLFTESAEAPSAELAGLPHHRLEPLDDAAAAAVVRSTAADAATAVVDAVVRTAAGNPFLLRELVRDLDPDQRAGRAPLPDPLRPTGAIEDLLAARFDGLAATAQAALLVAAAEPSGRADVIAAALAAGGGSLDDLGDAEKAELVRLTGDGVRFAHPALRAVAYHRSPAGDRRAAHRALAAATTDVEGRAWHLHAAAVGPDEDVACLLDTAADTAARRGAPDAASTCAERAARVTADVARRGGRLVAAASHALSAGDHERALSLAGEVADGATPVARARARLVAGRALAASAGAAPALEAVLGVVDEVAPVDPDVAVDLLVDGVAYALEVAPERASGLGQRAVELAASAGDAARARADLAAAVLALLRGGRAEVDAAAVLDAALARRDRLADVVLVARQAAVALHTGGRADTALRVLGDAVAAVRRERAIGLLPEALHAQAELLFRSARFAEAWAADTEAHQLARELGHHAAARRIAARLAGLDWMLGRVDTAREHYAAVIAGTVTPDMTWVRAQFGLGSLELGEDNPGLAVGHLEQIDRLAQAVGRPDLGLGIYEHDLAAAYVRVGRVDDARELVERFARVVAEQDVAVGWSALELARAVVAPDDEADDAHRRAIEASRDFGIGGSKAWAYWAERLVRLGRHDEAAVACRHAADVAQRTGASGVAAKLRATADRLDRGAGEAAAVEPTPSPDVDEELVALRWAAGLSVAEIARELFTTEATVGLLLRAGRRRSRPEGGTGAAPAAEVAIRVLGGFELRRGGERLREPGGLAGHALRLIAVRGSLAAGELAEALWPEHPEDVARARLRNVLNRLRAKVGPVVERRGDAIVLLPDVDVDLRRFTEAGERALALRTSEPVAAVEAASVAVEVHRGELLADVPYADWAVAPRERARRLLLGALDVLATDAVARGEVDVAVAALEQAAEVDPYDDERFLRAAEIFLDAGRRGAAAAMLRRARLVVDRLDLAPSPRHIDLDRRLRAR